MTTRTLEEIGADLGGWNLYPDRQNALDLLAIAQEQRGVMAADEERTRAAAMRVWGEHVRGCDTADAMADLIVSQRAEIARLQDNASTAAFDKIADQLGEANRENEEQRAEIERLKNDLKVHDSWR
jgi:NADH:ubiquinone oxidoreductase subunit E